jgi:alkanesulfonate monooxygenase SsuD/methylene tetrahydromethanopterin reductase-like flavin-dependent oxidoreductase (luciferase family)
MTVRSIEGIDIALGSTDFTRSELMLIARVADQLGVGTIYVTEGTGRDTFSVLNEMALKTERAGLGTGIVNVFSRTPTALAQAAASVLELMGDRRFRLGLGTSGRGLMEKFHGVRFDRPVTRLRETIQIIDHAFRTGRLPDGGEIFPVSPLRLGIAAPRERLSLYVAGLSDRTLRVTGRYADGWLPIWPSLAHGAELFDQLGRAAAEAGRPRPRISAFLYGGVGSGAELTGHVRSTLAWYVAANGTAYRRLFERYGYQDEVRRICDLWDSGDRPGARAAVPDHLLADTTLLGEPREFFAAAEKFHAIGVDRPVLRLPGQLSAAECVAMLARLAGSSEGGK